MTTFANAHAAPTDEPWAAPRIHPDCSAARRRLAIAVWTLAAILRIHTAVATEPLNADGVAVQSGSASDAGTNGLTGALNVRAFGGGCNGLTDDTGAFQSAAAALRSGQTLVIPPGTLVRATGAAGSSVVTFTGLTNFTISGSITNDQFGMEDSSIWKTIFSLAATGTVVYATTPASLVGIEVGSVVDVYCSEVADYCGAVTVTAVPDATHFVYGTLAGSTNRVTNVTTGTLKFAIPDFDRALIEFKECQHARIDLTVNGNTNVHPAVRHRLGVQALKFTRSNGKDNEDFKGTLKVNGVTYGIQTGSYRCAELGHLVNSDLTVIANDSGYPVALYASGGRNSFFDIISNGSHRGAYVAGPDNLRMKVEAKNYDQSALVITSHFMSGTNHFGGRKSSFEVTDTGTDRQPSWASTGNPIGRFGVGIVSDPGAGIPVFDDIDLTLHLVQNETIGRNINALDLDTGGTNLVLRNVRVHGGVDRSGIATTKGLGSNQEIYMRLTNGDGVSFVDWAVTNSAVAAGSPLFARHITITNIVRRQ